MSFQFLVFYYNSSIHAMGQMIKSSRAKSRVLKESFASLVKHINSALFGVLKIWRTMTKDGSLPSPEQLIAWVADTVI